jgi:hypothetical protein
MSQGISTIEIKLNDAKKLVNLRYASLVRSRTKECKSLIISSVFFKASESIDSPRVMSHAFRFGKKEDKKRMIFLDCKEVMRSIE